VCFNATDLLYRFGSRTASLARVVGIADRFSRIREISDSLSAAKEVFSLKTYSETDLSVVAPRRTHATRNILNAKLHILIAIESVATGTATSMFISQGGTHQNFRRARARERCCILEFISVVLHCNLVVLDPSSPFRTTRTGFLSLQPLLYPKKISWYTILNMELYL
jgi:hypothetical protein